MHVLECAIAVFIASLAFAGAIGEEANLRAGSFDNEVLPTARKQRRAERQFAVADALKSRPKRRAKGGRALQESTGSQSGGLLASAFGFPSSLIGSAVETVTSKPRETAQSILESAQLPVQLVPSVGSILDGLSVGRSQINAISSRLSEVTEVFNVLPSATERLQSGVSADVYSPVGSLASHGASGLSGMVASLASGELPQMALLDGHLLSLIDSVFPLSSTLTSGLTNQVAAISKDFSGQAASALETSQTIGVELDALLTLFSGGIQIPLTNSLTDVRGSFVSLIDRPQENALWIQTFSHLQQLREDLIRIRNGFNLAEAAAVQITESIALIDELLVYIGSATAELTAEFYIHIASLLKELGLSILRLNGTRLMPRLSLGGIEAAELFTSSASISLDLSIQERFLANAFDFVPSRISSTVLNNSSGSSFDPSSILREELLERLVLTTLGLVPLSFTDATQLQQILFSVQEGFAASLSTVTGGIGGGVGIGSGGFGGLDNIQDVFSLPLENLMLLFNRGNIDSLGLMKLLLLRETTQNTNTLVNQLNRGTAGVLTVVPKFSSLLPFRWTSTNQLFSSSFPSQFLTGITSPLSGITSPLSGITSSFTNGLTNGFDLFRLNEFDFTSGINMGISSSSGGVLDQFIRPRRLQGVTTPTTTVNQSTVVVDVESWGILAASAAVLESIDLIKLLHQAIVTDPCMSEDEVKAVATIRAVAVVGDPVDVLDAGKSMEQSTDVLGTSTSSVHSVETDYLFASSANCEVQRDILDAIERWATDTQAVFEGVALKAFATDADSLDKMLTDVESLDCNIPKPPTETLS